MARQANLPTAPVTARVVVPGDPARVFERFTGSFGAWWPLESHSVYGGGEGATCVFEPRAGGRIYERAKDGREAAWGRVLAVNAPDELRFTWHPGRGEETAQEVTVRFTSIVFATNVELEHGGWEKLGDKAKDLRARYEKDWPGLLDRFAKSAAK